MFHKSLYCGTANTVFTAPSATFSPVLHEHSPSRRPLKLHQQLLTCMTALNQQVLPMFFIPTGHSPTLLHSLCAAFSPQTSHRFLLERFLLSVTRGSWGLPGNTMQQVIRQGPCDTTNKIQICCDQMCPHGTPLEEH